MNQLVRPMDPKAFHPDTVVVIGNGAIENGTEVLSELFTTDQFYVKLGSEKEKKLFINREYSSILAHYSFISRAYLQELLLKDKKSPDPRDVEVLVRELSPFRRAIANAYKVAQRDNKIRMRELPSKVREALNNSKTGVITSNWDELLWANSKIKNLIQLHGKTSIPKSLILPGELAIDEEIFEFAERQILQQQKSQKLHLPGLEGILRDSDTREALRLAHFVAIDWLQKAKTLIFWGIAAHAYDAELISVLSTAQTGAPKTKVYLINPKEEHRNTIASILFVDFPIRDDIIPIKPVEESTK